MVSKRKLLKRKPKKPLKDNQSSSEHRLAKRLPDGKWYPNLQNIIVPVSENDNCWWRTIHLIEDHRVKRWTSSQQIIVDKLLASLGETHGRHGNSTMLVYKYNIVVRRFEHFNSKTWKHSRATSYKGKTEVW